MPVANWVFFTIAVAILQGVLLGLGRALGRPLRAAPVVLGQALTWSLFAWGVTGPPVIPAAGLLATQLPAPKVAFETRWDGLNDVVLQLLPWELEVRHALAAHRLPLWSDLLDGGSSPWANPQAGVLSPLLLLARTVPLQHFLLAALALKLLVASQGTWLLARRLGVRATTALAVASAVALGGPVFTMGLFAQTAVVAWMPWLWAATLRLVRRPEPRSIAVAALLAAAVALSGHTEAILGGGILAGVLALAYAKRGRIWRGLAAALLAAALGGGLAAPHLLPAAGLALRSERAAERRSEPSAALAPMRLAEPASWFRLGISSFLRCAVSPFGLGKPYGLPANNEGSFLAGPAVVGVLGFAGAVGALVLRRRRAAPLLAIGACGLLLGARFRPFLDLLEHVPPLRLPELDRFLPLTSLVTLLAAGLGLDALLRRRGVARWLALGLAAAISLAGEQRGAIAALLPLALATAMLLAARWRHAAAALLLCATWADLAPWARASLPRMPAELFYPQSSYTRALQSATAGGYRFIGESYEAYASLATVYGVAETRPNNPLAPARYVAVLRAVFGFDLGRDRYFAPVSQVEHPLIDFLGVRAVGSNWAMPAKHRLERLESGDATHWLYRNPRALPRWFLATRVAAVADSALADWLRALSDGSVVAVEPSALVDWQPPPRSWDPTAIAVLAALPGETRLRIATADDALLATSLPDAEGWQAFLGDRRLRTVRVDGAFFGCRVPRGGGEVRLRYRPPGLALGFALAAGAALSLGALGIVPWARRRARPGTRAEVGFLESARS